MIVTVLRSATRYKGKFYFSRRPIGKRFWLAQTRVCTSRNRKGLTRLARVGAQGKDVFSLLSVLGRNCVGALQFLPVDEAPSEQDMQYRIISEEEMVADLQNLAAAPLALGEDEDFRISIAGAQEKTAYLRIDSQWATTPLRGRGARGGFTQEPRLGAVAGHDGSVGSRARSGVAGGRRSGA